MSASGISPIDMRAKAANSVRGVQSSKSTRDSGLKNQDLTKYDVVGPICESTDCFQKDVELPESFRGDLIAVRSAGAYGEVMASSYNLRDRVGSVYSKE